MINNCIGHFGPRKVYIVRVPNYIMEKVCLNCKSQKTIKRGALSKQKLME